MHLCTIYDWLLQNALIDKYNTIILCFKILCRHMEEEITSGSRLVEFNGPNWPFTTFRRNYWQHTTIYKISSNILLF